MGEPEGTHEQRMAKLEAKQRELIAAVRSHLTPEENARATDRLIWQRGVKFGPNTPKGHAESVANAFSAADQYAAELSAELGLSEEGEPDE